MAWETRILVTENWKDYQNAYTNVTFTFQARRTDYSVHAYNGYGTAYWQIAAGGSSSGNVYFNINWSYGQNVWFTIASWTTSIKHNSDGTYSSYAEAYVYTGVSPSSLSARVDYTLVTIPRESSISSVTGDQIGGSITVNISRQSSSFTHHVWYRLNSSGSWVSLGTGYGTSCSFTLPMSLCSSVTQSTSATLNISIRAMSDGKYVGGEVYYNKTVYVPSNVVPSFSSISVSEAVSAVAALGIYVQNKSKLNLSINGASGSYGSWITSYTITAAGHTIRSASGTTGIINTSGTVTITATISDSRGRTATKNTTINVQPYSTPKLTSYSIVRQSTPTNVLITASGNVSSLKNGSIEKNKIVYSIKYKLSTSSSYTTTTVINGGLSFSNNTKTLSNIDETKSYDFLLVVSDVFSEVSYPFKLGTTTVIIDYNKNGIGIGKYWERGALDVSGDTYISNRLYVEGAITIPTSIKEGMNVPIAESVDSSPDLYGEIKAKPSFIGSINTNGDGWLNVLSIRHRNGSGDGGNFGMVLYTSLVSDSSSLAWNQQINGSWKGNRALLDSKNYSGYFGAYVTETGFSGIWRYRKWNNGIAECWGTWTGSINTGANNYSGYYYSDPFTVNYPSGLFNRVPQLMVDRGPTNFMGFARAFGDTQTYARFCIGAHGAYTQTVDVYMYAIGQWG